MKRGVRHEKAKTTDTGETPRENRKYRFLTTRVRTGTTDSGTTYIRTSSCVPKARSDISVGICTSIDYPVSG